MSQTEVFASSHQFDTVSDLITEDIIHPDDVAAIAGLKMEEEKSSEQSEEEFQEWLDVNMPESSSILSNDEEF
ncbi:hypothetical protein HCG51_11395 [Tolypothrix sp. PCC 7910]|uniref:hypothetical protein n=1 Tax=Tolypothrix sp. PCC 7910 TaxID=2099387 RepID=UPI00142798A0|nr:hypothetical protein [Tolypothrix sp. PCC 7910]QIR37258.1 hypothetical protein HCG51_11395 [Tolypothrix sp. PCC 7910]